MYQPEKVKLESPAEKAHEFLIKKKEYVDIQKFSDLYGESVIEEDAKKVADLEKTFEKEDTPEDKEAKKLADSFEILISQLAELENWLGEDMFLKETSKFDDLFNGVDMVAELVKEGRFSHLGLAIDVTFSSNPVTIGKKIKRITEEIKRGVLAKVKYFDSEEADIRGELRNIPRVIIGTDRETLNELADLWLRRNTLRESKFKGDLTDAAVAAVDKELKAINLQLRNHRVQSHILKQVEFQLEKFSNFAEEQGQKELAEKIKSNLEMIKEILDSKKDIEEGEDKFMNKLSIEVDRLT